MPNAASRSRLVGPFRDRFQGRRTAFGQYLVVDGGKNDAHTVRDVQEIPRDSWERHLRGEGAGLGVIPIDENDECRFGAIDVDDPEIDHGALARQVTAFKLPLVVCRSKSGGAHLYFFLPAPTPARDVQTFLNRCVLVLGLKNPDDREVEVFPKQTTVPEGKTGNWINLPYYAGAETDRYAFGPEGERLDLERFLAFAEAQQLLGVDESGSWWRTPDVVVAQTVGILAPHYPGPGSRNDFHLYAAGSFWNEGHDQEVAGEVAERLAKGAGDEEWRERIRNCVEVTYENPDGRRRAGISKLKEFLDKDAEDQFRAVVEDPQRKRGVGGGGGSSRKNPAKAAVETLRAMDLVRTPSGDFYAVVRQNGHREVMGLESSALRDVVAARCFAAHGIVVGDTTVKNALGVVRNDLRTNGRVEEVYIRIGQHEDGRVFYDLADDARTIVEIGPDGWDDDVSDPPVLFRRAPGLRTQVRPERGGCIEELRGFLNTTWVGFALAVGFMLAALHPSGPYPILVLSGEHGSAKTTTTKVIRKLLDPVKALTRSLPRNERDLVISATKSRILAFDNISRITGDLSDALCRMATDSGFSTRQLWTDEGEKVFEVKRPAILNSIVDVATRADLLDRAFIVECPEIEDEKRRTEREFWRRFEEVKPRILGVLFDAVSAGVRRLDEVELDSMHRMADAMQWIQACETGLGWEEGTFARVYDENQQEKHNIALASSPTGDAILDFMASRDEFKGSAKSLLRKLREQENPDGISGDPGLPSSARGLVAELKRLSKNLAAVNIKYDRGKTNGRRWVSLENVGYNRDADTQVEAMVAAQEPTF